MTAIELIRRLQDMPANAEVVVYGYNVVGLVDTMDVSDVLLGNDRIILHVNDFSEGDEG